MSRWRAFAIHLLISVLIAGSVAAVLFLVWYPPKLLGFAGAEGLLFLMAGIDIVAGPLLTLIVFKAGKKGLKFDLAVIALAQAAFLSYGVWTSWESRPVYITVVKGDLELVFANEIHPSELAKAKDAQYQSLPWTGARLVGIELPPEQRIDALFQGLAGRDVSQRPELYVDYSKSAPSVLEKSRTYDALISARPELSDKLSALRAQYPDARIADFLSSRASAYAVIDAKTAEPLAAVW